MMRRRKKTKDHHKFVVKGIKGHRHLKPGVFPHCGRHIDGFRFLAHFHKCGPGFLETVERQLETAKVEVTKPFAQEAELAEKLERLSALNALLNISFSLSDVRCTGLSAIAAASFAPCGFPLSTV